MTASKAPKSKNPVKKPVKATIRPVEKKPAAVGTKITEDSVTAIFNQIADKMKTFESIETEDQADAFNYREVITLLDMILAIDPDNRDAWNYKGMMFVGAGENAKAVECFKKVLAGNPADKVVLNNTGIALYGIGKDQEALKYVDKAIELDRRYSDALMNKAVILHGMGKTEEAESLMVKARALYSING